MISITLLTFVVILKLCDPAKILVIAPTPCHSHQSVFRPLIRELSHQGHHVTVITTNPTLKDRLPENVTEISIQEAGDSIWNKRVKHEIASKEDYIEARLEGLFKVQSESIEAALKVPAIKSLKKNEEKFDLIIVEAFVKPALIFAHMFKAPIVKLSTFNSVFGNDEVIGSHVNPILYPSIFFQRVYNLTFLETLRELYNQYRINNWLYDQEMRDDEAWKRHFGDDAPTTKELNDRVELLLVNAHPIWTFNKPSPPAAVYLGGGLQIEPRKKLPKDLEEYLDASPQGVVYISFGTTVSYSHVPPVFIQRLVRVLSRLPYNVLWKWNGTLDGGKNIKVGKWFPQVDVLRHPNVKLFISQAGAQSTDEAICAGVPLLGVPLIGDQWYNAESYVHHGIGLKLEPGSADEGEIEDAVVSVIEDEIYTKNMKRFRDLLSDQQQSPVAAALWGIQRFLRHHPPHAAAANMPWTSYLELELVAILFIIIFSSIVTGGLILKFLVKCIVFSLE